MKLKYGACKWGYFKDRDCEQITLDECLVCHLQDFNGISHLRMNY